MHIFYLIFPLHIVYVLLLFVYVCKYLELGNTAMETLMQRYRIGLSFQIIAHTHSEIYE